MTWLWHWVMAIWIGTFVIVAAWGIFRRGSAWYEEAGDHRLDDAEDRTIQRAEFVLWEAEL